MSRVTSANLCRQELPVLVTGKAVVLTCQKSGGHPGPHSAPVKWPVRTAPPAGRRISHRMP